MLLYGSISMWVAMILVLWHNRQQKNASIFLALLLFILGMHGVSHATLLNPKYERLVPYFYNIWYPLYVLIGPFLFFYVRASKTERNTLSKADWLHFLPFLLLVADAIPYWFSPFSYKQNIVAAIITNPNQIIHLNLNWFIPARSNMTIRPLLIIAYSLLSFQTLIEKKSLNSVEKKSFRNLISWQSLLCLSLLFVGTTYLITVIKLSNLEHPQASSSYFVFRSTYHEIGALIFIALPVLLNFFPKILYGLEIQTKLPLLNKDSFEVASEEIISEEEELRMNQIALRIKQHLEEDKPFLNHKFSMDALASSLNIPRHQVYKCMAKTMKVRFTDLRMQMRIDYAKKLLSSGMADANKLEAVAIESGFVSRSNFHSAFKALTGLTPTEYLQQLEEETNKQK